MVSDGTHTSTATLTINLTDINDNAPVFGSSFYTGTVAENSASGKIICIVVIKTRVENILLKKVGRMKQRWKIYEQEQIQKTDDERRGPLNSRALEM